MNNDLTTNRVVVPTFHIFHSWSPWEEKFPGIGGSNFQIKKCVVCHKKKSRWLG